MRIIESTLRQLIRESLLTEAAMTPVLDALQKMRLITFI